MMGVWIVLAVVLAVEPLVFSAPARISAIKRRALSSRAWRWGAILFLGSLPTLVHLLGLIWISPQAMFIFDDNEQFFEYNLNLDYELRDEFITELRWRTFVFWDKERCFTSHESVCAGVDNWYAIQAERQPNDQSILTKLPDIWAGLYAFAIFSIPSYLTSYAVYRITHDTRKQKYG